VERPAGEPGSRGGGLVSGRGMERWRSAIYEGEVRHRRFTPRPHAFRFRLFMTYLDLAEVPALFESGRFPGWSTRRGAVARFRRADYLEPHDRPLDEAVRDLVAEHTGARPTGPVRMLTQLRHFGYCFNPVTFYYCFAGEGAEAETEGEGEGEVESVVAEITNTPWKERHRYVLASAGPASAGRSGDGRVRRFRFAKDFHVSPFMPMDLDYDWAFRTPIDRAGSPLSIHMNLEREGERVFDATLRLRRQPISGPTLRALPWRHPLMTARIIGRIHLEAGRLWLKRIPVHAHPGGVRSDRIRPRVDDAARPVTAAESEGAA